MMRANVQVSAECVLRGNAHRGEFLAHHFNQHFLLLGGAAGIIPFRREDENDGVAQAADSARIVQGAEGGADARRTTSRLNERLDIVAGGDQGRQQGTQAKGIFRRQARPAVIEVRGPARGAAGRSMPRAAGTACCPTVFLRRSPPRGKVPHVH